jgi:hypothetical protein
MIPEIESSGCLMLTVDNSCINFLKNDHSRQSIGISEGN